MPDVGPGQLYHFQTDGPHDPDQGSASTAAPTDRPLRQGPRGRFPAGGSGSGPAPPKCVVVHDEFDWQRPLSAAVICGFRGLLWGTNKIQSFSPPASLPLFGGGDFLVCQFVRPWPMQNR